MPYTISFSSHFIHFYKACPYSVAFLFFSEALCLPLSDDLLSYSLGILAARSRVLKCFYSLKERTVVHPRPRKPGSPDTLGKRRVESLLRLRATLALPTEAGWVLTNQPHSALCRCRLSPISVKRWWEEVAWKGGGGTDSRRYHRKGGLPGVSGVLEHGR